MSGPEVTESPVYELLQLLCAGDDPGQLARAADLLDEHPDLSRQSIHAAAMIGDVETLRKHLEIDPDLWREEVAPAQATPLILACLSGYFRIEPKAAERIAECARVLMEHGADPNTEARWDTEDASTRFNALQAAAGISGNAPLTRMLLDAGADPVAGEVLFHALSGHHFACAELLLQHGADVNSTNHPAGYAALHWILESKFSTEAMNWLLAHGADPNLRIEPFDETALHVAVRRRRPEATEPLLQAGAKIDAKTRGGKTAYAHARRRGFQDVADKLAALGADQALDDSDRLAICLMNHDLEGAKAISEQRPELILTAGPEDARMLPDLAARGNLEAVRFLVDSGIDLESRGLDGGTALQQAAWFGQLDVVEYLIDCGGLLNLSGDWHQSTPLGWAAHGSTYSGGAADRQDVYVKIVKSLLAAGAAMAHPLYPERDPDGRWLLFDASPAIQEIIRGEVARRRAQKGAGPPETEPRGD